MVVTGLVWGDEKARVGVPVLLSRSKLVQPALGAE